MSDTITLIKRVRRSRQRADDWSEELEREQQMREVFAERVRHTREGNHGDITSGQ